MYSKRFVVSFESTTTKSTSALDVKDDGITKSNTELTHRSRHVPYCRVGMLAVVNASKC